MRISHRPIALVALVAIAACNSRDPQLAEDPRSAIALSGGPNTSMTYLARTDSGIVAIDLGWWGYKPSLRRALDRLGASEPDVKYVFITHSHRDHIAAWPTVRRAHFYLASDELPRLLGSAQHTGWMVRIAERLNATNFPDSATLDAHTFSRDTLFVFGTDTLRAYIVPGHTAGSAVYLFRGVLFVGDAVTHSALRGFRSAKAQFSDDPREAQASLAALWPRVPLQQVRVLCTAHGECAPFTSDLANRLGRP